MEEESFIDAFGDVPTDLAGDYSQLYIFHAEDFGAWCRRVRDAHEREVDGGVDSMTDAQLADHGLCRIGSAAEDNERFRREAGPFCDRLREAAAERADVTLFGVDYIALPVDADGVPIRVGDVVTMQLLFGGESKPLVVDRMELSHGRDGDLWYVALDTDKGCWNQPSLMRHYTPPTVEDVLRALTDEVWNRCCEGATASDSGIDGLVAECAAKLRLAGDGE